MQTYLVGGAVRDMLLDVVPKDRDWVVTGATPEEMLAQGFEQVGASFPVFIHPESREEYALARTEKKTGEGYHGFTTDFNPEVTIEEDLYRRDFTINSIALEGDVFIDPYGGQLDIHERVLRSTNPDAFMEDPLRVLRLARFAARFPNFTIESNTAAMARIVAQGKEFANISADRVGKEMMKALAEIQPSRFFYVLNALNALHVHFPEVAALVGQTQPPKWHPEGDAFVHTMEVLDQCRGFHSFEPLHAFLGLSHDFGKGLTPKEMLPHHYGHEAAGVRPVQEFCDRLRLPAKWKKLGALVAKYHMHVHKTRDLNPKTFIKVFEAFHGNINDLTYLIMLSIADNRGRGPESRLPENTSPNPVDFLTHMLTIDSVRARHLFNDEELEKASAGQIKNAIFKKRIANLKQLREAIYD